MIYERMCYLSILLSFGIEIESRLPFFIADGADDCAIAVEFRRFTANALLLATCKAALALRRRGGSVEFPVFIEIYLFYLPCNQTNDGAIIKIVLTS